MTREEFQTAFMGFMAGIMLIGAPAVYLLDRKLESRQELYARGCFEGVTSLLGAVGFQANEEFTVSVKKVCETQANKRVQ